ncbi:unnamed protein product [Heligmosomoides polygyrus]|uniref:Polypeptide N-acetylgalactosaminyltransferase 10 n=1 Tax=Heligmosomoides polygyrus TaxID=6339 RepID=A0A183GU66_HELPZ|nr:unnamed protein product [Heligmosomoides polygyrus]
MSFARLFVPRRKENVLNLLILLAFCAGIVFYYRLDADHWSTGRGRRRPTKWSWERKPVDPSAPGENGQPVILQGEDKIQGELDMKKWFMNVRASDMMSLDRSIPDSRREECLDVKYDLDNLPQVRFGSLF